MALDAALMLVRNADGFDGVAARAKPSGEAAWDVPSGSLVKVLEMWVECEFETHRGFIKARNLPSVDANAPGEMVEVRDGYEGNKATCMRRSAVQDSSKDNLLCYVPNGPKMVKLVERWVELCWNDRAGFVKARHVAPPSAEETAEPPTKLAKTDHAVVKPDVPVLDDPNIKVEMLGPPCNLLVDSQPDWRFELGTDQWRSYRADDAIELDRYWKVYCNAKAKGMGNPHIANLRLMKKDAVVDFTAMTCQVAGGKARALERQTVDQGWLSNAYFWEAFKKTISSSGVEIDASANDIFDFRFNQDFRELEDDGRELKRGGQRYELPCGWKRFSVKVHGQYDDGDNSWLKEDDAGWAVAYHGTYGDSLPGILSAGFKVGPKQKFSSETGVGIYCTPWIDVAQHYSEPKPLEGHCVQVVLQLRVKPSAIKKVTKADSEMEKKYWVINDPKDMRAYGVLVRELSIRDFVPALLAVFGPDNANVRHEMAKLKRKADDFEKAQKAAGGSKAKAKVKTKAKAKTK